MYIVLLILYDTINIQHNIRYNKQFEHNLMNQLTHILLFSIFLNVAHQIVLYLQVHELVVTLQTFFMFVVQCENILMFIFDSLIKILVIKSFFVALTIIVGRIGLKLAQINKFVRVMYDYSYKLIDYWLFNLPFVVFVAELNCV